MTNAVPSETSRNVVVFLGPSLPITSAISHFPEAVFREPAERGDVLRAALRRPAAICLIDGYFEHRLAVQHKEILWALSQGVAVFGASSMGALRAAELDRYGMIGHGAVYAAYACGELDHDDEVAVIHTPAPDFRLASEALVNIRVTLAVAEREGVIPPEMVGRLVQLGRSMFYADRSYEALVAAAAEFDAPTARSLGAWLAEPGRRVDQKQSDAIALLARVRSAWQRGEFSGSVVDWEFVGTAAWSALWTEVLASIDP